LKHATTRFWLRTVEGILLALFVAVALLAWRLARGPLSLDPLAPYIENALAAAEPGIHLKIGHASLHWSSLMERPVLTVEDVRATSGSGVIAALPRMVVELSVPALLRGAIAPEDVVLSNALLRLTRRADGTFAIGFQAANAPEVPPTEATSDSSTLAEAMVSALTRPAGKNNPAAYLSGVTIDNTTVVLRDEETGQQWLVPGASLKLRRAASDVLLTATLPVVDPAHPWTITVSGRYVDATQGIQLSVHLDRFRPAAVAGLAPQLAPLAAIDMPLDGELKATLSLANNAARLDRVEFDLKGESGTVHLATPIAAAYPAHSLSAKGSVSENFDRINVDEARLEIERADGNPVVTLQAIATQLNGAPTVTLDIGIENLSLQALKGYWPEGVKDGARTWIAANLNNGSLPESHFHVVLVGPDIRTLTVTDLQEASVLKGIDVTYMPQMPPVQATSATMNITQSEVAMNLSDGVVPDAISGRGLRIRGGSIRLTSLGTDHEHARVALDIVGDLGEVMRLVDHKPLGYASAMGLDARTVTGAANVNLDIGFPLLNSVMLDRLDIAVKAKVDGAKIPNAAFGQPLTDSHLTLQLDRAGMDVSGTVALAGVPAVLKWRENFGAGPYRSRYEITAALDNATRPLVGLAASIFAPPYLDGPARGHVVYVVHRDGTASLDGDADLADATMTIGQLGWRKEPGVPAHATASVVLANDHVTAVSAFHLNAGDDVDIAGAAKFGPTAELTQLSISRGHVGASELTGELAIDDSGTDHLDVHGPAFNSTYFWKQLGQDEARGSAPGTKTALEVHAAFDRMWLAPDGDFRDVRLELRQSRAGIEQIALTSTVDGTAPFVFDLDSKSGKHLFHGSSSAGGGVVRAIGLTSDMVGGNLQINGELAQNGTVDGTVEIKGFKLVRAPVLARLLSVASFSGIVDQLKGKGISFKILKVPFSYANSQIKIKNGEMFGSALGLTARGSYRFPDSMMDFEGTVIPSYTINSALNSIPLLGTLLTGSEKGGGVLAATYTFRGPVATAQPTVNPLAALAPGIMRRIFDIFKAPAQSSAAPKTATPPQG
jgi:hypothetical protein